MKRQYTRNILKPISDWSLSSLLLAISFLHFPLSKTKTSSHFPLPETGTPIITWKNITHVIAVAAGITPAKALEVIVEVVVVTAKVEAVGGKTAAAVFDGYSNEDNAEPVDVTVLVVDIPGVVVVDCKNDVITGNEAVLIAVAVVDTDCPLQQVIIVNDDLLSEIKENLIYFNIKTKEVKRLHCSLSMRLKTRIKI